jgi:xanthine dehydrogenase accessory factor
MALFLPASRQVGSLSGGCVEEELLGRITDGELPREEVHLLRYGVSADKNARLGLPCGGHLDVLLQCLEARRDRPWLDAVLRALGERRCVKRSLDRRNGETVLSAVDAFEALVLRPQSLQQSFGPQQRMLLVGAGASSRRSVAELALGHRLCRACVCDPSAMRRRADWSGTGRGADRRYA